MVKRVVRIKNQKSKIKNQKSKIKKGGIPCSVLNGIFWD